MFAIDATLMLFDMTDHALLSVNLADGQALCRMPLPAGEQPLSIFAHERCIRLFANRPSNGILYTADTTDGTLSPMPITLPPATCVCTVPHHSLLYLATARRLYRLDLSTRHLTALSATALPYALIADCNHLYAVSDRTDGTLLHAYTHDGTLLSEHLLSGTVTTLHAQDGICYLPFTESRLHGEGLYILCPQNQPTLTTISLQPHTLRGLTAYPYGLLIQDDILYLSAESASTITRINRHTQEVIDCIPLGHSISNLYPLPDNRFALATSNMFADLVLIDLINNRLLSLSNCPHEIFPRLMVLPPA